MPVRALRPISLIGLNVGLAQRQNPINARKGITTRYLDLAWKEGIAGQNPINARKGITT